MQITSNQAVVSAADPSKSAPALLLLRHMASLRLTLGILVLLALGTVAALSGILPPTWALSVPLALCALNLGSAVATNAAFRRQLPLLMFHLALLAIVVLVAAGRMTYLKGHVELSEGEVFSGELTESESGPWHVSRLNQGRFANLGFEIDYQPGIKRAATRNRVAWLDEDGVERQGVIGDTVPLVLHGYRFYTSFNKGFAPKFLWLPTNGAPNRGTIHLPAYPLHEYRQALEWTPPGSDLALWTQLQFDEVLLDEERASNFRLPQHHKLVIRRGESRWELGPGERLSLPGGLLQYEGLTAWMGYTVFYDWTITWLLAACVLAVISLAWHFWSKFRNRPWDAAQ